MPPKSPRKSTTVTATTRSLRTTKRSAAHPRIALYYRLFFLYIEPVSALLGAAYALLAPHTYLTLLASPAQPPDAPTTAALSQLANLYALFAINEAVVLRATRDLRVWRAVLAGLALADLGHLASLWWTGGAADVYLRFWAWNGMGWGGVGFVYAGFVTRMMFMAGVGVG